MRLRATSLKLAEAQKMPSVTFNSSYGRTRIRPVSSEIRPVNWTVGASMSCQS